MAHLDDTDRRILAVLDEDARLPVAAIAARLGLARATVQTRLTRMADPSLLRPASARVRPAALGRGVSASIRLELDQHQIRACVAALERIPEVVECFAPAGDTDLLLRVVARDPDDLYRVAEEVRLAPGVLRTSTSMFLREVIPYRMTALLAADSGH